MGYKQSNNPFSRKTSSPLFSKSPLRNNHTDPDSEDFTVTSDVTTGEGGNTVRVMEREKINVVDPTRTVENVETDNEKYLNSFNKEFSQAQQNGFEGTLIEYIKQKEEDLGFKGKEEKVIEQRTITDTETPTEEFEEIERPKTFFEDFRTEYNFPSYERGEDRRIKIDGNEGWTLYNQPVTGKSGNKYNKVNFNDERTTSWLETEEGGNVLQGGEDMLNTIENKIRDNIINSDPNYPWTNTRLRVEVNKFMDWYGLGTDKYRQPSSDARKYGMNTGIERWLNMFVNNPAKLEGILGHLGLTQEGGTVTDKRRIEGSESDRTDTGWQTKN